MSKPATVKTRHRQNPPPSKPATVKTRHRQNIQHVTDSESSIIILFDYLRIFPQLPFSNGTESKMKQPSFFRNTPDWDNRQQIIAPEISFVFQMPGAASEISSGQRTNASSAPQRRLRTLSFKLSPITRQSGPISRWRLMRVHFLALCRGDHHLRPSWLSIRGAVDFR